ncbi:MAG: helix-turn-helix transcriptional regulator [Elusimicrobia bacterium]|nr:helix-turn-helix transcriptional regulator [Elusimicrobiota bacterium]
MKSSKTFFCEQLRKALYEKRLTQKALAEKIGVNRPVVNRWMTGSSKPSFDSLKKISSALNLPLNYFGEEKIYTNTKENIQTKFVDIKDFELLKEKVKNLELEIELIKAKNSKL